MKQTPYSRIWELTNIFRNDALSFLDLIDLISTIIAAKLISNNKNINSIEEANEIISKDYEILVDNDITRKINNPETIKLVLNEINSLNFDNNIVDWLLEKSTQPKFGMTYDFKPGSVSDLAKIVKIPAEGRIADFNANISSFIKEVIKQNKFKGEVCLYAPRKSQLKLSFINIYPVNKNLQLNILGNNVPEAVNNKFDFIFAMPPFGLRRPEDPITNLIENTGQLLKQKGSLMLVVPSGFLFNARYRTERDILLDHFHIDSIINLTSAFRPYTAVETAMIYIINDSSNNKDTFVAEVNFIDNSFEDIKVIVDAHEEHLKGKTIKNISPLTNRVSKKELEQDFVVRRFDPKILALEEKISKKYHIKKLGDICKIKRSNSRYGPKDYIDQGRNTYKYIRIQDIKGGRIYIEKSLNVKRKETKELLLKEGDILLSVSGTIGKVSIVDSHSEGALFSQGLVLLKIKDKNIDPIYLYNIFQSSYVLSQLSNMSRGAFISHVSAKQLEELRIPVLPLTKQRAVVTNIKKLSKQLEDIKKEKEDIEKKLQNQLEEVFF